jgi:hypothetical protein
MFAYEENVTPNRREGGRPRKPTTHSRLASRVRRNLRISDPEVLYLNAISTIWLNRSRSRRTFGLIRRTLFWFFRISCTHRPTRVSIG